MNWQKVLEVSEDRNRKNMNLGLKAFNGRVQKGETLVIIRPDTVIGLQGNMTEAESRAQSVFDRPVITVFLPMLDIAHKKTCRRIS